MLGHLALSVAMAFVYGGDDAQMAQRLDDLSLGSKTGTGLVVSYADGVSLRVGPQSLASIGGSSLGMSHAHVTTLDPIGGIDLALAELERVDDSTKWLLVDEHALAYRDLFAERAHAAHVTILPLPDVKSSSTRVPPPARVRITHCPSLLMPSELPDDAPRAPWDSIASLALLGLAAGLARRATV